MLITLLLLLLRWVRPAVRLFGVRALVLNVVLVKAFEFELDHIRGTSISCLLTRLLYFNFLLVLRLIICELDTALVGIVQSRCLQEQSLLLGVELLSVGRLCNLGLGLRLLDDQVRRHRDFFLFYLLLLQQPMVIRRKSQRT